MDILWAICQLGSSLKAVKSPSLTKSLSALRLRFICFSNLFSSQTYDMLPNMKKREEITNLSNKFLWADINALFAKDLEFEDAAIFLCKFHQRLPRHFIIYVRQVTHYQLGWWLGNALHSRENKVLLEFNGKGYLYCNIRSSNCPASWKTALTLMEFMYFHCPERRHVAELVYRRRTSVVAHRHTW